MPVVFSFLAELLPTRVRGRYMCALASCWMLGSIATAALGWALVPRHPVRGWRVFLALAALPSLACAALTWRCAPESPRWLLAQRRPAEAQRVLRAAALRNRRGHCLPAAFTLASPPPTSASAASAAAPPASALAAAVAHARASLHTVLSPPLRATSLTMCAVWASISFGWYGTVLWFPEYFARRGAPAAADAAAAAASPPPGPGAPPAALDARPFADQLAVAFANLPGNLLSVVLIESLGRRATLAAGLAAGALCALAFAAVPRGNGGAALAAACAFNGASVGAWNALDTYSAEVVPTRVRATALGLMSAAGRLGAAQQGLTWRCALCVRLCRSEQPLPRQGPSPRSWSTDGCWRSAWRRRCCPAQASCSRHVPDGAFCHAPCALRHVLFAAAALTRCACACAAARLRAWCCGGCLWRRAGAR